MAKSKSTEGTLVTSTHDADGVVHEITVLRWYDRRRVHIGEFSPSKTQQHFKAECDINNIVKRGIAQANPLPPQYGDFTDIPDFQAAQNTVIAAQQAFMAQPSALRARFNNNPAEFLAFVSDEANRPEMERLGLLKPSPAPAKPAPGAAAAPAQPEPTSSPGA